MADFFNRFISAFLTVILFFSNIFALPMKPFEPTPETPEQKEPGLTLCVDDYAIILPAAAKPYETTAAKTLQDYLKRINGITLPIQTDETAQSGKEIVLGFTNRSRTDSAADLIDDGYLCQVVGTRVFINGAGTRGTIYGVYHFLEEVFGCHWYTKDLIVVPEAESLLVPQDLNMKQEPYFESRETDWISPNDATYSLANNLNGGTYRHFGEDKGCTVNYLGGFCHTLATARCARSTYFETHPEYFAYRIDKRERVDRQLCLTNPDVVRIVTQEVLDLLRANYNPESDSLQIVSLTQDDNQDYCQCDKCRALDEANGSHAGTMITFVNQVAKAVKDAGYDKVAIDTFAYQYTRQAPTNVKPDDNVIVRLCSIECCFSHAMEDKKCPQNVNFMKDFADWGKICSRIYIWDYTTNYSNYIGPFCDFGVIQPNMQTFVKNNVKGVYEEGNYTAAESNGEFAELRAYLLSRLMWDPYLDYEAEMDGFLKAYYGGGWQYVREFIRMMTDYTGKYGQHMTIYRSMTDKSVLCFSKREINYCDDLWQNAVAKAGTPAQQQNVERSLLCWRYWKACNRVAEFSRKNNKDGQESQKLYDDFVAFGIRRIFEGGNGMLSAAPDLTNVPREWYERVD